MQSANTFGAFEMKKHKFCRALFFLTMIFCLGIWFAREMRIDSCLDRGGRWNNEIAICEDATE
jgi:hypothetical protein